ncbi:MAG: decarboxylating 6-phosphogluconate dehydrogenase [Parcubacteria group bacterium]|nr:decarboxylating 6-phosphogluconate dehydrogenase [Parcubacteria group bacterium]
MTPPFKKELGYVGLGKMGKNMVLRLAEKGWKVLAFDRNPAVAKEIAAKTIHPVAELNRLLAEFSSSPRIVWLMVPAGKPVDDVIEGLGELREGDIVVDGGNSFYEDSHARAQKLAERGIHFLDVGVSGGPGGARNGASLMVGGERDAYEILMPLWNDLAVAQGFGYVGGSGAGHFVKMVHNGIEYGMMQALAEGFAIMKGASAELGLIDLAHIAHIYNHGSVIESSLTRWLRDGFKEYGEELREVSGSVAHTGEGEWTVKTAHKLGIPAPIIEAAFAFRVASEKNPSYTGKILSALRNQFGGHSIK